MGHMMGVAQVIGMNPTLRSFFSIAPPCANTSVAVLSGKNCESAAERRRRADRFEECAARGVLRKHCADYGGGDDPLVAPVLALGRRALERRLRVVFGLAAMPPAAASRPIESALGIEGAVEGRHGGALQRCAGGPHRRRLTN